MRDFYDVYILTKIRYSDINKEVLRSAILRTMQQRNTYDYIFRNYHDLIKNIEFDDSLIKRWNHYKVTYPYAVDIDWLSIIESVKSCIMF